MTTEPRVLMFPALDSATAAAHLRAELALEVDPDDLVRDLTSGSRQGYIVVETRAPEAFASARIPGAINLPYREMTAESVSGLDRELVYVCYCESIHCNAATKGALKLAELGFKVKRLSGGIAAWQAAGYPVDRDDSVPAITSTPTPRCAC
ncbi:rhodanese-like domain-containing protein [Amycolatopsis roodepoortensis]|uniref:rhodanese-like domain-containing protein n=1 Tax=Amycolatopsis roodepoortensis TaxID=700274 RepID=UPI00214C1295|nr:rhodanese-like domain-containing protein [Amycolatopsis roodepoortensis]UUV35030.1 rhodanese-like domain-containing protein [Amycolatopsis roodepoortensis]